MTWVNLLRFILQEKITFFIFYKYNRELFSFNKGLTHKKENGGIKI